jgi:thiosulfate dehydrogenase [quinone] large subunit
MGTLAIGGLSALLKGSYRGPSNAFAASGAAKARTGPAPAAATRHPSQPAKSLPRGATKLGPSNRLPAGQAATYQDPVDGQPDILIRDSSGHLSAFSAVCTHAGCTVGYQQGEMVCPCHGGTFDARTGAVVSGPPPQGLARKRVIESGGNVYAVPS